MDRRREGDYSSNLAAMLDALTSPDHPALRALTARTTDDPAIALLDAAAVLGDVLSFHDARIAAEGYLRTATDLRSLALLGRLVGYRPHPGLSATTHLAYTLDARSVQDGDVVIPCGARSRSVPASSGEESRTFETDAELFARAAWNVLPVRRHRPDLLVPGDLDRRSEIRVAGTNTLLDVGDRLLFLFGTAAAPRVLPVAKVRVDLAEDITALSLPSAPPPSVPELVAELRQWMTAPEGGDGEPSADVPNPRPVSRLIADFDVQVLAPLRTALDDVTTPEAFVAALAGPLRRLAEAAALARPYAEVTAWFERLRAVVANLSDRALDLGGIAVENARPLTVLAVAPEDALRALVALRVAAVPFGATAPLQAVRDEQGHVVTLTDWPLPGATFTTMRVVFDSAGRTAVRAEFVYAQPQQTVQHAIDLPGETSFNLGPGQVEVQTTAEAGVTATLRTGLPERVLRVSAPDENRRVQVSVGDDNWELSPGGPPVQVTQNPYEITVRYTSGTQPASVEIGVATVPDPVRRLILPLDKVYDTITVGSWVVVERPGKDTELRQVVTRVTEVRTVTYTAYGTTGRGTQLVLAAPWLDAQDVLLSAIRDTTVYAAGEQLRVADEPLDEDLHGDRIELSEYVDGLRAGRALVVTGERTDLPGTTGLTGVELARIAEVTHGTDPGVPGDHLHTTLTLTRNLTYRYRRATVRVLGNVVPAGDGESRDEPIGSGDATAARQRFTLWQEPLAWRTADSPLGAAPALEIRVDGLLWHPVDSFAGRGPADRVYVLGAAPDGRTTITFGDGEHGARLPTGQENARARYRYGTGVAGNVPAGRINQPVSRPLGVIGVTNPVPATGGAAPDGPGLARRRIPLAVSALDRLLSVADYADFARSRVGVGRAAAREVYDGRRQVLHVTVTGVDDAPIDPSANLLRALRTALSRYGDSRLPVRVDVREKVSLRLAARVALAPDHDWAIVEPALRAALLRRLGYPGRDLARGANLSEIMATAHAVPGVDYVDVDVFTEAGAPAEVRTVVPARPARYAEDVHQVTDPAGETLTVVAHRSGISLAELLRQNPGITSVAPLPPGTAVRTFLGIRPAQLTLLTPAPGSLILTEIP